MKMQKQEFMDYLKKVSNLTGQPIQVEVAEALFGVLGREHRADILFALKNVAHNGDRVNLANILKYLRVHKSKRLESEVERRKVAEKEELDRIPEGELKKLLERTFKKLEGND